MSTDNLATLLNKLLAFHVAGIITLTEIGKAINSPRQRVQEWITIRNRRPNGETAIKLLALTVNLTLKISRRPELREKYRHAFEAACMKFPGVPVEGKE